MNMESDEVGACSSPSEISDNFNVAGTSQLAEREWISPLDPAKLLLKRSIPPQKIRRRRNPVRIIPVRSSHVHRKPTNEDPDLPKHKLPTIHEGKIVFHRSNITISDREMRIRNREPFPHARTKMSKERQRAHKALDNELMAIVARLRKVADNKPEMLKETLEDDTIELFKSIHIK